MARTENAIKNMTYAWVNNILTTILSFISRTIFINVLGATYLGLNGLFTNILSVLSFTELGIGTAINFSLYKPVAENNQQKISLLMKLYKNAYRLIAIIITILGLAILPFLHYLAKDVGDVGNISLYYLIFLFNTVISYFVSYKSSLLNANQKNYIYTRFELFFKIITTIIQIIVLLLYKNFLIYLLVGAFVGIIEKIMLNIYLNKLYPCLKEKVNGKLEESELKVIKKNIKALIYHKFGDVAVHQTDNIVVSSFINVTMTGLISNYTLIITSINSIVSQIFNSAVSSLGNLIATEKQEHQYEVFKSYNFLNFWIYGFCTISLATLLSPFISLMWGSDKVISGICVNLMCIDFYMVGQRSAVNNVKVAGGIFKEDKLLSIFQAIINLIVSIILVKIIGLPGVYIGTIVSGILATVVRPIIIYKKMFNISCIQYFKKYVQYFLSIVIAWTIMFILTKTVLPSISLSRFIIMVVLNLTIPNLLFLLFFYNTNEFNYLNNIFITFFNERRKKCQKNH